MAENRAKELRTIFAIANDLGMSEESVRDMNETTNETRSLSRLDHAGRLALISALRDIQASIRRSDNRQSTHRPTRRPKALNAIKLTTPAQRKYIRDMLSNPDARIRNPEGFLEKQFGIECGDVDKIGNSQIASDVINCLKHRIQYYRRSRRKVEQETRRAGEKANAG